MKRFVESCLLALGLSVVLSPAHCFAQYPGCTTRGGAPALGCANPAAGNPACGYNPACGNNPTCCQKNPCPSPREGPPQEQPSPRGAELPPVAQGMFASPPRTGAVAGPTRGLAINGLKITFPELTLKFPSIELPGFTRFRRGPYMRLDQGQAPYVENPYYASALLAREAQMRQLREARQQPEQERAAPRGGPPGACAERAGPPPTGAEQDCQARLRALEQQLEALNRCIDGVRNQLANPPQPPVPPADFPARIRPVPPTESREPVRQSGYEVTIRAAYDAPAAERRLPPSAAHRLPPTARCRRLPAVGLVD